MKQGFVAVALLVLAGCGSGADDTAAAPEAAAVAPAAGESAAPRIAASRAEVEQAWKCRGLMSAAFAARTVLADDMPGELEQLDSGNAMYWTERASQLETSEMTGDELDLLVATSTRVLATRQAVDAALPEIVACLDAQRAG